MSPALPLILRNNGAIVDPRRLPHLAAWYDISDASSLSINGSNQVQLIADKSGNSGVNCLVLNGAAGNYASAPDSAALSITGDIDLRVRVALADWTPTNNNALVSKWTATGDQRSYQLAVGTTGVLLLLQSTGGTAGTISTFSSTVALTATDLSTLLWLRATLDVDNGAAGRTATFYTSTDGVSWTQLGTAVTIATAANTFDGTGTVEVGTVATGTSSLTSGRIYRAQIYDGIAGTLAFDANFALPAKLATSFTESSANAATVTINTSGDLGARISGERDLVQMTATKRPVYTAASGGVPAYITFDGSDDYMKAAPFSLSQPETVYFVGSQVTWTANDGLWDGNALDSMQVYQAGATPNLALYAGATAGTTSALAVATRGIFTAVYNGASSQSRVGRGVTTTGNAGAANASGFTLCAKATPSAYANITANAVLIYAAAHPRSVQDRVALYAKRQYALNFTS